MGFYSEHDKSGGTSREHQSDSFSSRGVDFGGEPGPVVVPNHGDLPLVRPPVARPPESSYPLSRVKENEKELASELQAAGPSGRYVDLLRMYAATGLPLWSRTVTSGTSRPRGHRAGTSGGLIGPRACSWSATLIRFVPSCARTDVSEVNASVTRTA